VTNSRAVARRAIKPDHTVEIRASHAVLRGIKMPTRRRVYVRHHDGRPARESVSIAIDITDVAFS
jgi:hypothetical protein